MYPSKNFIFWRSILETVDLIEEMSKEETISHQDLVDFLDSLQHRLRTQSDPLENFEAFVFHRFCRSIGNIVREMKITH